MKAVVKMSLRKDIVLPVSDEMDCSKCHASNTVAAAQPAAGWVNDPNAARDFRQGRRR